MHKESPSLGCNYAFLNPLDYSHASPMCSQPLIFPKYYINEPISNPMIFDANNDLVNMVSENVDNFLSVGYFCRYDASLDPYCIFLVDKPGKTMWNTFFAFSFDFSIGSALLKRALTFFAVIIFMLSYCHTWKLSAEEFDKLLHSLTLSDLKGRVLTFDGAVDAPCALLITRRHRLGACYT